MTQCWRDSAGPPGRLPRSRASACLPSPALSVFPPGIAPAPTGSSLHAFLLGSNPAIHRHERTGVSNPGLSSTFQSAVQGSFLTWEVRSGGNCPGWGVMCVHACVCMLVHVCACEPVGGTFCPGTHCGLQLGRSRPGQSCAGDAAKTTPDTLGAWGSAHVCPEATTKPATWTHASQGCEGDGCWGEPSALSLRG